MAEHTEIAWCDSTFNPWIGCLAISPGCAHCYAAALAKRFGRDFDVPTRTSEQNWKLPKRWHQQPFHECQACGHRGLGKASGYTRLCNSCGADALVRARRRVFCASMADVFDNRVSEQWRIDLFRLIAATANLDWLLLTKRIGNAWPMRLEVSKRCQGGEQPMENVWIGATVVNQQEADRDIPKLLSTPARVRFLSCEPLLGPIELRDRWFFPNGAGCLRGIDWIIVGAESGPKARPMHLDWARSIVEQCRAAGVACHVKQLGATVLDSGMSSPGQHWPIGIVRQPLPRKTEDDPPFFVRLKHSKGGDMAEWPDDMRVREFPEDVR